MNQLRVPDDGHAWAEVPGLPGVIVSDDGQCLIVDTLGKWIIPDEATPATPRRLRRVRIPCTRARPVNGEKTVGRMMLQAHVGPAPDAGARPHVIDGNALNCVLSNLAWR